MKHLIAIFSIMSFALFSQKNFSRDTIYTKSGHEYICLITELDQKELMFVQNDSNEIEMDIISIEKAILGTFGNILNDKVTFRHNLRKYKAYIKNDTTYHLPINYNNYELGDQQIIFSPTAFTIEKNNFYFGVYEFTILNFAYSFYDNIQLEMYRPIPADDELSRSFVFSLKFNYLKLKAISSAINLYYTSKNIIYFGNTISVGNYRNNLNFNFVLSDNSDIAPSIYSFGAQIRSAKNISWLLEYLSTDLIFSKENVVQFGLRYKAESSTYVFGVLHTSAIERFTLIPLIKGTFYF
jgi:hypothetical protein